MSLGDILAARGDDIATDVYYTVYFENGEREVIRGQTFAIAIEGETRKVAWFDNGCTDSHYFNTASKIWEPYQTLSIDAKDFRQFSSTNNLAELLDQHRFIEVNFENKDQLYMRYAYGCFARLGWLRYIEICYGEYNEGSYNPFEEDAEGHYYMAVQGEFYQPALKGLAVQAFIERFDNPNKTTRYGQTLYEILNTQTVL